MIERIQYINLFDCFHLPKDEFMLTGSIWLALMNIRKNDDIDIIISESLSKEYDSYFLKIDYPMRQYVNEKIDKSIKHTTKIMNIAKEKTAKDLIMHNSIIIDGFRIVKFDLFRKYKQNRKGDKHEADNKAIKSFFKHSKNLLDEYKALFVN